MRQIAMAISVRVATKLDIERLIQEAFEARAVALIRVDQQDST